MAFEKLLFGTAGIPLSTPKKNSPVDGVKQLIELNKKGDIPISFDEFTVEEEVVEVSFEDAMGQDNINRFDKKNPKKSKKRKRPERRENYKKNKAKAQQRRQENKPKKNA